jgi:FAD/FMN-containing dehydrogenase
MRDSVLGIEAVLPDGSIVSSLTRLVKNSTGVDPRHIFIGSEGTLGIITRLTLRLHPPLVDITTAWVSVDRFDALPQLLHALKRRIGESLCAYEFMSRRYISEASRLTGQQPPVSEGAAWHVLIEAAPTAGYSMQDALQGILADALEASEISDCAVATSLAQRDAFWRLREAIPEILSSLKPAATLDIGLPWKQTASYIQQVESELQQRLPDAEHLFLGHLGDNNIHIISGPVDKEGMHAVDEISYAALQGRGGTISAEHGVGRIKKEYLSVSRNPGELAFMRRLKEALDPSGILNPGRIID